MFSFLNKNNFESINVNDLNNLTESISLIDVREPYEYKSGHVPNAKNVPMNLILTSPEKYLDSSKKYYIVCQSGGRSSRVCSDLIAKGYKVVNVAGGTGSYVGSLER